MSDYNAAFADALRRDMDCGGESHLRKRTSELVKNREVERLFPGRDALWLQKELSKWRGKLADGSFNGTLRSLQVYCMLMGVTPNDVLLPGERYTGPGRVELLREETIVALAEKLRSERIVIPHGMALPILYAPERMTAVFLFLLPQRHSGEDTVTMRFAVSEPEGYAEMDGSGGIATAMDSSLYMTDLSQDDWETRLRRAYKKIRGEFDVACSSMELPLQDVVHEFYDLAGDWAEGGDLLFAWYPPKRQKRARKNPLDSLDKTLGDVELTIREI